MVRAQQRNSHGCGRCRHGGGALSRRKAFRADPAPAIAGTRACRGTSALCCHAARDEERTRGTTAVEPFLSRSKLPRGRDGPGLSAAGSSRDPRWRRQFAALQDARARPWSGAFSGSPLLAEHDRSDDLRRLCDTKAWRLGRRSRSGSRCGAPPRRAGWRRPGRGAAGERTLAGGFGLCRRQLVRRAEYHWCRAGHRTELGRGGGLARPHRGGHLGRNRRRSSRRIGRTELRDRCVAARAHLVSPIMRRTLFALLLVLWASDARATTIERATTPAGIETWFVEGHPLSVVSIGFALPGGAALDPAGKGGLAALAASLLDEGAGPYDTASFKTRLEDLVIDLRFEAGRDEIAGGLRSLKRNLGEASDLLRLALAAPRFEPSAIERVRGEIVASLSQQAQNPRALSSRLWIRDAFDDHPYGGNVYGTLQSVGTINRDDLKGFVAQRLLRAGLVIGAVGDVTRDELAALVDRVFGGLPAGDAQAQVAETKQAENGGRI